MGSAQKQSQSKGKKVQLRRPLSAYNLFFRDQREEMKRQVLMGDIPQDYKEQFEAALKRLEGKRTSAEFQAAASTIAIRWKNLDPDRKGRYEKRADRELELYRERKYNLRRAAPDDSSAGSASRETTASSKEQDRSMSSHGSSFLPIKATSAVSAAQQQPSLHSLMKMSSPGIGCKRSPVTYAPTNVYKNLSTIVPPVAPSMRTSMCTSPLLVRDHSKMVVTPHTTTHSPDKTRMQAYWVEEEERAIKQLWVERAELEVEIAKVQLEMEQARAQVRLRELEAMQQRLFGHQGMSTKIPMMVSPNTTRPSAFHATESMRFSGNPLDQLPASALPVRPSFAGWSGAL